jgi:hypothetical protein
VTLSDTTFSVTGTASPFQLINAGLGSRLALGQAIPLNVTAIGGSVQTVAYFNLKSDTALNNTNNLNNTNTNNLNNNTTNNTNPQEGILSRLWNGATSLVSGGVSGIWTWITGLFQN